MKPLILIVEDRPEIATSWSICLRPLDVDIVIATNLLDAFVIITKIPPPDLVLLDLNLSAKETPEFTITQIEKMKQYNQNLVVIVVSGFLSPNLITLAASAGAHAIKEKLDMSRQVDMWHAIEESLANAPAKARNIFEHPLKLLENLTKKLHIF